MKDSVTNKQLYEAIIEIHKKIDEVVDERIVPIEKWQSRITGQMAVVGSILIIIVNIAVAFVRDLLNRKV